MKAFHCLQACMNQTLLIFAAIDLAVMFAYALAGAQAIRVLRAKGVLWLDRLRGGALLALAGSLALYRRQGL